MAILKLTDKQTEFAKAALSNKFRYLMYGGAIRGGKTVVALALIFMLCKIYPRTRWAIVRKDLPALRKTTIPSFESIRPTDFVGPINKSEWTATCTNGSQIIFFPESIDKDPDLNRWKGLEVNGFVFEEANECSEKSFLMAVQRAGSWKPKYAIHPPPLILMTCNPARNWVKKMFYDPWKLNILRSPYFYLPASIKDNPHLDPAYLESLETLKGSSPSDYARFVLGDWDTTDDPNQLILYEWILKARLLLHVPGKKSLGIDPARFGPDDTVFAHRDGNALTKLEYHSGIPITRTAELAQGYIEKNSIDANRVYIDTVGLGAGVADILVRENFAISEVVGGSKAIERDPTNPTFYKYNNLRTQILWELRERFRQNTIALLMHDPRLAEDLTAHRYFVKGDKTLVVESKDDTKKRIGRSPDASDATSYAFSDLDTLTNPTLTGLNLTGPGARANPWNI